MAQTQTFFKRRKVPIKDGASIGDEGNFVDHWFLRAASNFKPSVCDIHGQKVDGEVELYSGAHYRCKLSAWGWNHPTGGKGVSVNIETAIKTRDDEKFGGGGDASKDFEDDISTGGEAAAEEPAAPPTRAAKPAARKPSPLD